MFQWVMCSEGLESLSALKSGENKQQNFIISNPKGPALTVQNKPYTFICIDCNQAFYRCSIKPEVRNAKVRYTEILLYSRLHLMAMMVFSPV